MSDTGKAKEEEEVSGSAGEKDAKASEKFMGQKERRRSSALKMFFGDYLNLATNSTVQKLITKNGDKKIVFSDIIIKVNKRNKMQERVLLLTEHAMYNIDPGNYKCKRRIALKDLSGISLSKLPDNFFALHVPSEYDYLLVSSKKTEIVTRLLEVFEQINQKPLPVEFSNIYDYRIDSDTIREIHFSRVDGGVSTQIYTKSKPK